MAGEADLQTLLRGMEPVLDPVLYVFARMPGGCEVIPGAEVFACVREDEGTTLIIDRQAADHRGLAYQFACRRIVLSIHSALEAVGLTAAVATTLADAGISANVVAGYFHDHVFVPAERADEALRLLEELAARG